MKMPIVLSGVSPSMIENQAFEIQDPTRLQNPYPFGIMVTEISFESVRRLHDGAPDRDAWWVQLKVGREQITDDYIPVSMLAPIPASNAAMADDNVSGTSFQRWVLPKPMYLPAFEFLFAQFRIKFFDATASWGTASQFRINVVGYVMDGMEPPKERAIPYVSYYESPNLDAAQFIHSNQTDLDNPFDVPMYVEAFIGKLLQEQETNIVKDAFSTVQVQLINSQNEFIMKDLTPFGAVFFNNDAAWPVKSVLAPSEYFIANINAVAAAITTTTRAGIAMMGYRMVRV